MLPFFRLFSGGNVPLTVQLRGGWRCFLAGAEPFVERLTDEDACGRRQQRRCAKLRACAKGLCMVHGRPISSHFLLPDRLFVFCVAWLPFFAFSVARPLDPALAPGALFESLTPRWGLEVPMRRAARTVPGNLAGWSGDPRPCGFYSHFTRRGCGLRGLAGEGVDRKGDKEIKDRLPAGGVGAILQA